MKKIIMLWAMLLSAVVAFGQINIWENEKGHKKVEMYPYVAPGEDNPAVVVCPGGSYFWHDMETEGHEVAKWLQKNGISAFVLKYRAGTVAGFVTHYRCLWRGNQYPDPQEDLQRTILYVKERAGEYGINPAKVGAMGFSAGGHLVMSVAEKYDSEASRPAFVAPIYPVVTFVDPCMHKRSLRGLLGEKKKGNKQLRESLSLELNVPDDCPPVFLMNCMDDPIVKYHNSELLAEALAAKGVRHKYIQYKTGGHGFGASEKKGTEECRAWKGEFLAWLTEILKR